MCPTTGLPSCYTLLLYLNDVPSGGRWAGGWVCGHRPKRVARRASATIASRLAWGTSGILFANAGRAVNVHGTALVVAGGPRFATAPTPLPC